MKKFFILTLLVIAGLSAGLRLYKVDQPIADWHSWRQADTAAVARNFAKNGIDLLHPRYDDLSNIQTGKDNPEGWRMVEFPLYQGISAWLFGVFGGLTIEMWLRIVSIAASVGSTIFLGLLVAQELGQMTGLVAALVYAVLPYSVYYGRTILPDVSMVFWSLGSLFFLFRRTTRFWWVTGIAGGLLGACALLSKPMAVFLLMPAITILSHKELGFGKRLGKLMLFGVIAVVPLLWWRQWILQFPEGIPAFAWLLNKGDIRFKGAWFYWLFARRLSELILGWWGIAALVIGVVAKKTKQATGLLFWWIIGGLLYFIIFAAGNVQHDYYQILIIPIVAALVARGYAALWGSRETGKFAVFTVTAFSFIMMLALSWYTVRTYYWINRQDIITAGQMADKILPKNAKVIAPYNGDTTFLYQTNRAGWPLGFDIDQKIAMGATAYVTVSPTDNDWETRDLSRAYQVLVRNDKYAIIDLTRKTATATPQL